MPAIAEDARLTTHQYAKNATEKQTHSLMVFVKLSVQGNFITITQRQMAASLASKVAVCAALRSNVSIAAQTISLTATGSNVLEKHPHSSSIATKTVSTWTRKISNAKNVCLFAIHAQAYPSAIDASQV